MESIEIQTSRLLIRQFCGRDAEPYFQLISHPRAHCFAPESGRSREQAALDVQSKAEQTDGSELAVCRKDTGEFIGTLFGMWEEDTFSVCWNFLAKQGGRGYAYEAAEAYLDFLFRQKNARRIYACVEADNGPSQRLCQKLGMRLEGVFPEFISFVQNPDGTPLYETTMQFAILKKEWLRQRPDTPWGSSAPTGKDR